MIRATGSPLRLIKRCRVAPRRSIPAGAAPSTGVSPRPVRRVCPAAGSPPRSSQYPEAGYRVPTEDLSITSIEEGITERLIESLGSDSVGSDFTGLQVADVSGQDKLALQGQKTEQIASPARLFKRSIPWHVQLATVIVDAGCYLQDARLNTRLRSDRLIGRCTLYSARGEATSAS